MNDKLIDRINRFENERGEINHNLTNGDLFDSLSLELLMSIEESIEDRQECDEECGCSECYKYMTHDCIIYRLNKLRDKHGDDWAGVLNNVSEALERRR